MNIGRTRKGSSSCPTGRVAGLVVSGEALGERQLIRALAVDEFVYQAIYP